MSRSSKKGPYVDPKLLKKVSVLKQGDRSVIKTWARHSTIAPEFVGFTFGVHNGKTHVEVIVKEEMVGHRFGEFSLTRKFVKHGGKLTKQLEAAAAATEAAKKAAATAPAAGPAKK
jgi:small subunit ribosomal protein S19